MMALIFVDLLVRVKLRDRPPKVAPLVLSPPKETFKLPDGKPAYKVTPVRSKNVAFRSSATLDGHLAAPAVQPQAPIWTLPPLGLSLFPTWLLKSMIITSSRLSEFVWHCSLRKIFHKWH